MIALQIAKKNFIEFFRDFKSSAIVVIMPLVMIAVFGFIFKGDTSTMQFNIGYVTDNSPQYQALVQIIKELKNTDQRITLFIMNPYEDIEPAKQSIITNNNSIVLKWNNPQGITLIGDNRNPYFGAASGIINKVAIDFFQIEESIIKHESINAEIQSKFTAFDLLVPGLMIYGLLILIPHTAGLMTEIREKNYLLRYYLSKATSFDIIMGYTLSQMALAIIQTILLFYAAQAFGFKPIGSIFDAAIIAIPANLFIVGTGLLIGAFVNGANNAANVGTIVSVILGFMSGSFIVGIETVTRIGEIGGRMISFNQIFASTFATQALSQVLLYGKPLKDIGFELTALTISSLIVLIAGIYFYNKLQLKKLD
jgi:ABC-2 type transport system permease protein